MEEYLIYAEKLNVIPNSEGLFEYEFYFSSMPESAWGEDWNQQCPSACSKETIRPDENAYEDIKVLKADIPLLCISDNSCFSCQDMCDGIVACAWEDITDYESYPEPYRICLNFGESIESVEKKLEGRSLKFE